MTGKINLLVILPVLFYFLQTSPYPEISSSAHNPGTAKKSIYLVKIRWHTGIVFKVKDIDTLVWNEAKIFKSFKYIDAGWGDAEFYQAPGFEIELAFAALFYPTPSALRIEGFNLPIEDYINLSDIAIEIPVTERQFRFLCRYIQSTYLTDSSGRTEILSEHYNGNIKFYAAKEDYHLFNTCNTWIARALHGAGFDISDRVILAEQLFYEAQNFGIVLKTKTHE